MVGLVCSFIRFFFHFFLFSYLLRLFMAFIPLSFRTLLGYFCSGSILWLCVEHKTSQNKLDKCAIYIPYIYYMCVIYVGSNVLIEVKLKLL